MNLLQKTALCAAFAALAGCGTNLVPAPAANETPGKGAVTMDDGVRMLARADAWTGTPQNLEDRVTPILVTITNDRKEPVRIAYNQFRLVSDAGRRYSALPPFAIDGTMRVALGDPYYAATGFGYAPYFSPYFRGAPLYDGFGPNFGYWNRFGPVMRKVSLPTEDMLDKALPEGVLQPGGRVSGFLYFEGIGPDVKRVELRADFKTAQKGERVARLEIPFVVK